MRYSRFPDLRRGDDIRLPGGMTVHTFEVQAEPAVMRAAVRAPIQEKTNNPPPPPHMISNTKDNLKDVLAATSWRSILVPFGLGTAVLVGVWVLGFLGS